MLLEFPPVHSQDLAAARCLLGISGVNDQAQTNPMTRTHKSPVSVAGAEEPFRWAQQPESTDGSELATVRTRELLTFARNEWIAGLLWMGLDVLGWLLIYGAVCAVRRDAFFVSPLEFVLVDVVQLFVICGALFMIGGYDRTNDMRSLSYFAEHLLALIAAAAVSSLIVYTAATYESAMKPSRAAVLLSFLVFVPWSMLYRRALSRALADSAAGRAFLVIGSGELAMQFYRSYKEAGNRQRLEFVDLDRQRVGEQIAGPGTPVIEGDIATKLQNLGDRYAGVVVAERVDRLRPDLLEHLVRTQFALTRVYTLESFYESFWKRVPVSSIDAFWPLQMRFQLARISAYHYLKRLCDIGLAAGLLVMSSPLLVLVAAVIRLVNGAPIFFAQSRVGAEGRPFRILKFRTMKLRAEDAAGDIYTQPGDARVTRLGGWLRKSRVDELPQLWNVLRGEMSLIGPRAEWTVCAERYEKVIPFYHFRHLVKPGITGWAQVNYPYGASDEDAVEKLKYDLYYIRHYSLKLDAMIVLKTVHTMLFARGR